MFDSFGRNIDYLRFSITDRCDLRCRYCMPQKMTFTEKKDMLNLEQLKRLSSLFIKLGIKKIRITGGEPLIRKDLIPFIKYLKKKLDAEFLNELTMTTNGTLLEKYAKEIYECGIKRLNVSLDTLIPEKFNFITNGGNLNKVLSGISRASEEGIKIKINCVLLKNFNEEEIIPLSKWCSKNKFILSFIETMPLGEIKYSRKEQFLPISFAKKIIEKEFGLMSSNYKTNGPSRYFLCKKLNSEIGFISPLSNHFCSTCNRIRITSNGILYTCLGHEDSVDLKPFLNEDDNSKILMNIKNAINKKPEKHFFEISNKEPTVKRFMNLTGG